MLQVKRVVYIYISYHQNVFVLHDNVYATRDEFNIQHLYLILGTFHHKKPSK